MKLGNLHSHLHGEHQGTKACTNRSILVYLMNMEESAVHVFIGLDYLVMLKTSNLQRAMNSSDVFVSVWLLEVGSVKANFTAAGKGMILDWYKRLEIAVNVAQALDYLHSFAVLNPTNVSGFLFLAFDMYMIPFQV